MKEVVIKAENIFKSFNGINVLNNISFEAYRGEILCIIGPSGCGKTTVLKILGGFIKKDSGKLKILEKEVERPSKDSLMIFKDPSLFPWLTIMENIIFYFGKDKKNRIEKGKEYIEMVGLKGFENYYPKEISTGMEIRASIIRALITNPQILLMDEPFSPLDAINRRNIQDILLEIIRKRNLTVVIVTHDIEEALYLGDRIIVLGKGENSIKKVLINEDKNVNIVHSPLWEELYNTN